MEKPILLCCGVGTVTVIFVALGYKAIPAFLRGLRKRKSHNTSVSIVENEEERELRLFHERKPPDLWNTVLFFPDTTPDADGSPTKQFLSYFENTKMSLQICIYLASYPALEQIILAKRAQGLLIQVLSDHDSLSGAHNNFSVNRFRHNGIPVRTRNFGHLMHHKFVIFDEEAVMSGSLNWTKQGFAGNTENVVITTHKRIVAQYIAEFNRLYHEAGRS